MTGPRLFSASAFRTALVPVLAALLCAVSVVAGAAPARAAGYRYWSFWTGDRNGAWAYATEGPATARPGDGQVDGFRFAVSRDSADADRPGPAPDFAAVCGATPAEPGRKRIGIVIDFGTAADAPAGQDPPAPRTACARVAPSATSAEALAAVAKPLRYNSQALLCAIAGYPESGCGEQVADSPGTPTEGPGKDQKSREPGDAGDSKDSGPSEDSEPSGSGPSVGVIAGLAAVLLLGAAAGWQARRRRDR
ncbi:SCO2322 family protein [Streptomyces sp. LP05-1]|uniref:SCO2322 family protein n=1 Tax=Streptomyces pyxinae TaxID=2970734 RepID=A0ABT2CP64_9ACTN|nr:SCO2322 family protein [Streptomyces sp. LP05-1]MCS0639233.1 SCO2322 family protein [Streptomyces sp. LP05-1]